MKFMVTWSTHTATRHDVFKTVAAGTGVAICESDDVAAVHGWAINWNGTLDVVVRPVLDDQAARNVIRNRLGME